VGPAQFGPSGKLVLSADRIHLALQTHHLLLQSCRVVRIFRRGCRELVVEDPELRAFSVCRVASSIPSCPYQLVDGRSAKCVDEMDCHVQQEDGEQERHHAGRTAVL